MDFEQWLFVFLLRGTILAVGTFLVVRLLFWFLRLNTPFLHRLGSVLIITIGCLGAGFPVDLPFFPVYEPVGQEMFDVDLRKMEGRNDDDHDDREEFGDNGQFLLEPVSRQLADQTLTLDELESNRPVITSGEVLADPFPPNVPQNSAWFSNQTLWGVLILYFGGILFLLLKTVVSYYQFCRSLSGTVPAPTDWAQQWNDLLEKQGYGKSLGERPIPMLLADSIGPALLCRFSGYLLVVPPLYWSQLSEESRETVLRHELAHYQRRDGIKSLLIRLLALVQWYNPLIWLSVRRFDEAAEWSCDEAAFSDDFRRLPIFAEALLQLCDWAREHEREVQGALQPGLGGRTQSIRISRLVQHSQQTLRKDTMMKKVITISVLFCLLLFGLFQINLVAVQVDREKMDKMKITVKYKLKYIDPEKLDFSEIPGLEGTQVDVGGRMNGDESVVPILATMPQHRQIAAMLTQAEEEIRELQTPKPQDQEQVKRRRVIVPVSSKNARDYANALMNLLQSQYNNSMNWVFPTEHAVCIVGTEEFVEEAKTMLAELIAEDEKFVLRQQEMAREQQAQLELAHQKAMDHAEKMAKDALDFAKKRTKEETQELRYEGKTFAEWEHLLQMDLSPEQQRKAYLALREFGREKKGSYGSKFTRVFLDKIENSWGFPGRLLSPNAWEKPQDQESQMQKGAILGGYNPTGWCAVEGLEPVS
ncbi:MAG: M56 family metallopeptidase [Thermoguttaceae bacterium]